MENQQHRSGGFGSRGEYLVALQVLLMAVFVVTPALPLLQGDATYRSLEPARWLLAGLCWMISAFFTIGGFLAIRKYLTPLPYPVDENRLIITGVYRLVRHPLYTAIMLAFTGWTIFTTSLTHLALTVVAFFFFSQKGSKEEAWLIQRHPEYTDYAARTGKFIPRFRKNRSR
jgi:protein-S-isoprenylcysteine O-methyltransferase Ste14